LEPNGPITAELKEDKKLKNLLPSDHIELIEEAE